MVYIGLMSGTSLDAVDGVLAEFTSAAAPRSLASASVPLGAALRSELLALNSPGPDELHRAAMAANALADLYAAVVERLLQAVPQLQRGQVRAIGAHGQTVRHQPQLGYTIQLNAPARLAEATGIPVVADLRSRDVAAGGQGAPLVPAFHQAIFGAERSRVILNLGGIANITVLAPGRPAFGFDTGPANMLLDLWCQRHTGQPYDAGGAYAASGKPDAGLLSHLLESEPWLALPPPKSTGRDLFSAAWLERRLTDYAARAYPVAAPDVQATLVSFTASTVATAIRRQAPGAAELYVCGGGAANPELMRALAADLPGVQVQDTSALGLPPQEVEAMAFAWLAHVHVAGLPGNLPEATGARGLRVLGAWYPA